MVAVFVIFMPAEPTWFYWFNFAWAAAVALLSSLYLNGTLTHRSSLSSPIIISLGAYIALYVILLLVLLTGHFALVEPGVIWVLADFPSPYAKLLGKLAPLFLNNLELGRGIYLAVLIVITATFGITVKLLIHFDRENTVREQQLSDEVQRERELATEMRQVAAIYRASCRRCGIVYTDMPPGQTPLDRVAQAFNALTPNVMRHHGARTSLSDLIDQARALADGPMGAEQKTVVEQWAEDALQQIKEIKQSCRL